MYWVEVMHLYLNVLSIVAWISSSNSLISFPIIFFVKLNVIYYIFCLDFQTEKFNFGAKPEVEGF